MLQHLPSHFLLTLRLSTSINCLTLSWKSFTFCFFLHPAVPHTRLPLCVAEFKTYHVYVHWRESFVSKKKVWSLSDTVTVMLCRPRCSNEQRSPWKHVRATGFLSIDWNYFVWPLLVLCLHKNHPWKSGFKKRTKMWTKMLEVKLFFLHLHWIHPLCSPTGLLCLSGLIVYVCLFAYLLKAHAASLCISQQCTFSASIGSCKSWTTSRHLKTGELGKQGPLSWA